MGMEHRFSKVYHPPSNGKVERCVRSIKSAARCIYLGKSQEFVCWGKRLASEFCVQEAVLRVNSARRAVASVPWVLQYRPPLFECSTERSGAEAARDLVAGDRVLVKDPKADEFGRLFVDKGFWITGKVRADTYRLSGPQGDVLEPYGRERLKLLPSPGRGTATSEGSGGESSE
jgi:hypothetical protein